MCIDQCQNQLHLTNKQVIPNEVTCNPTDDTARDDELSSSFASFHHTSNHGSNYFHNRNSNHQNGFALSTSGAKHSTNHENLSHQVQNRPKYCPMLPPPDNSYNYFGSQKSCTPVDHHNNHNNQQSHFVNANSSINYSSRLHTEQLLQQKSNKQPPKKSFIGRKTNINKAEKAVSRLFADSIASQDTSGNCNVSTATANEITVKRQVSMKKICFNYFLICQICHCLQLCFNISKILLKGLVV